MAFDDLPLGRATPGPPGDPARPSPRGALRWVAVAAGGIVAGGLLTFWWLSRSQPTPAVPAPTTATDVAVNSNRPKRQAIDLPSLDDSDTRIAALVSALSRHPLIARLVATHDLVRAMTLAVVQIGEGRTPADPLKALRPSTHTEISGATSGRLDPSSYARWDGAVAALTSVSPADAAQLYVNVKPLFDQAYIELGHPGGDFDDAVSAAIRSLAETPATTADPILQRRTGYFEYDDETLRELPPVEKQFLLIGADNRHKVMTWLTQFASNLDLKTE
jgi:hypothetical protein